ncbi:hypothetical protein ACFE04_000743 [Oxalis oulophora]
MLKLANDPQVLKKLDMTRIIPRLPFINNSGRAFLAMLSNHGIKTASLLIATDLFFIQKNLRDGIHLLIHLANEGTFQAKYNCAIALILLKRRRACKLFMKILLLPDNRYTLRQMRHCFLQMIPTEVSDRFPLSHFCMHNDIGKRRWTNVAYIMLGDKELNFECVYCCIDMEIFKIKKKVP